jgi:hypothetical protein
MVTTTMEVAAALCCLGAIALALYLYHALWLAPERVRAALRVQGVAGPRPSFPYGNRDEMRRTAAAAAAAPLRGGGGGGIVHDYRAALFPHYERWREEYGMWELLLARIVSYYILSNLVNPPPSSCVHACMHACALCITPRVSH